jgi:hypothetical protein
MLAIFQRAGFLAEFAHVHDGKSAAAVNLHQRIHACDIQQLANERLNVAQYQPPIRIIQFLPSEHDLADIRGVKEFDAFEIEELHWIRDATLLANCLDEANQGRFRKKDLDTRGGSSKMGARLDVAL